MRGHELTLGGFVLMLAAAACGTSHGAADGGITRPPGPAPELGNGDHTANSVTLTVIADAQDGLRKPRDLAFNPRRPDELWSVNEQDESVVIVHDASTDHRMSERRKDGYALHFMAVPAAIDFGADATTIGLPGTFATCGESRNTYDGQEPANDFMGPTLWSSDLSVFAVQNPHGLGSHLDMLHMTPLCMGISHQVDNVYWTIGGLDNALYRYDFGIDNGIGNDDHSDGVVYRFATGELKYAPGVPSHLFFRQEDEMLYVADTGNARIVKLDTNSGTAGRHLQTFELMKEALEIEDAVLTDVVTTATGLLTAPSGLEIKNDLLYVSDNATSRVSAFTLTGERVNYLDTGLPPGSLSGMAFGPDGKLYAVDMVGDRVLRIDPKP